MNYELRPTIFGELYRPMAPSEVTQRAVTIADMMDKRMERQKTTQRDETARDIYRNAADPITGQLDQQKLQASAYQQGLPEVAQAEQQRQQEQAVRSRQEQLYGQQANNAAYELKLKKYEHGADIAQLVYDANKDDLNSPNFQADYEYNLPVFREAGMDFLPDKWDDSVPRKLQMAARSGKMCAEKMKADRENEKLGYQKLKDERLEKREDRKINLEERKVQAQEKVAAATAETKEQKIKDAEALKTKAYQQAKNERNDLLGTIQSIKNDPALATGYNPKRIFQAAPGTPEFDIAQKVKLLSAKLAMNARGKLKGQGTISDTEQKMLAQSQSLIDGSTSLSKKAFVDELDRLEKSVQAMDKLDEQEYKTASKSTGTEMSDEEKLKAVFGE